ncbi:phage portal protein [Streptomyces sioyaensis]|uniref:phage portal protein n=1 Tax=Streptomyces sioyaensis TaxID=67364 RepID=UPI003D74A57F
MGLLSRFRKKSFTSGGWNGTMPPIWSPSHPLASFISTSTPDRERIENDFEGYVQGAYKNNGAVFACMLARQMVFSEARFIYRAFDKGRAGDLFSTPDLEILKNPWPGGTTGELLVRMEQDASLAGNFFGTLADDEGNLGKAATVGRVRIARLRPDWMSIVVGSNSGDPNAADAQVILYIYQPKNANILGTGSPTAEPVLLMPDEVAHYSPLPDPVNRFRGMSWLTPIINEIEADSAAVVHKRSFFENSAVPNMAIKFDKETSEDAFDEFVSSFDGKFKGKWNAYKTLFLMGGADVAPLSHDFKQLEFSQTVGKGESRIAAAAGVPSSWVGFSEGMQGSSLNAGNFNASRRRFADGTIRPMWRMAAASLSVLVPIPAGAELWYDERDIAFLREDATDRAEIMRINLNAIDAGIKAGYKDDAVVMAVRDNDVSKLIGQHTGLVSVQMQAPQTDQENERTREEADIRQVEAAVITSLTTAGFELASIVAALESGDWGQLKVDAVRQRQAEAAAVQQERSATATPDKPPKEPKPPPASSNTDKPKGGQ